MMVAVIIVVVLIAAFFYVKHLKKTGAIFPKLDAVVPSKTSAVYVDEEEE